MKPYSDFARQRTLQILGDVIALLVLVGGILAAVAVHGTIVTLDAVGREVQASGEGLSATMTDVGDALSSTPLIGEGISAPFGAASDAADSLAAAGENWQLGVHTLAATAAWTVVAIIVAALLFVWFRPRIVGAVRRGRAARLAAAPNARELLALRAIVDLPAEQVLALHPNAMDAWRRGDPAVIRDLAALHLRASGVRLRG